MLACRLMTGISPTLARRLMSGPVDSSVWSFLLGSLWFSFPLHRFLLPSSLRMILRCSFAGSTLLWLSMISVFSTILHFYGYSVSSWLFRFLVLFRLACLCPFGPMLLCSLVGFLSACLFLSPVCCLVCFFFRELSLVVAWLDGSLVLLSFSVCCWFLVLLLWLFFGCLLVVPCFWDHLWLVFLAVGCFLLAALLLWCLRSWLGLLSFRVFGSLLPPLDSRARSTGALVSCRQSSFRSLRCRPSSLSALGPLLWRIF